MFEKYQPVDSKRLYRLNDERRVKKNTSGSRTADAFLSSDVFIAHSEKYSLDKLKQSLESIQKCGSESINPMPPILTIFLVPSKIVEKKDKKTTSKIRFSFSLFKV